MEKSLNGKGMNTYWKSFISKPYSSSVLAVVVLFIVFALSARNFLSMDNMYNVLRNSSLYILIAIGQAIVITTGGMDLSLGAVGGLTTVVCGLVIQEGNMPIFVGVIAALAIGLLAGLINGLIITRIKINSFVTTLATSFVFTGLTYGISEGFPYTNIPNSIVGLGQGEFLGMPLLLWFVIVIIIVLAVMYKFTLLGRRILATGGNVQAAKLSGIKTNKMVISANMMSGLFASIAGVCYISRMGSASPTTGSDWMLISFAVAVIGGTALQGGVFSSLGLLCSGIMFALIKNGLIMLQVNVYFEQTFLGLVILLAVAIESIRFKVAKINSSPKTDDKNAKIKNGKLPEKISG
jgi:ribose transport system permease protein